MGPKFASVSGIWRGGSILNECFAFSSWAPCTALSWSLVFPTRALPRTAKAMRPPRSNGMWASSAVKHAMVPAPFERLTPLPNQCKWAEARSCSALSLQCFYRRCARASVGKCWRGVLGNAFSHAYNFGLFYPFLSSSRLVSPGSFRRNVEERLFLTI